jgi:hypothetical protein
MKKGAFILAALILLATFVSAADLQVQKIDKGSTAISELNNPTVFELIIVNNGTPDIFEIYSLAGLTMTPKEKFNLTTGEEKTIEVTAWPNEGLRKRSGFFNVEYQIKGDNSGIFKDGLRIKIVSLADAINISVNPILPTDKSATIVVKNVENAYIENVKLKFDSAFFSKEQEVSLKPYEEKSLQIPITKNVDKLLSGPYMMNSEAELTGKSIKFESIIEYLEKEGISTEENTNGFIIRETTTKKTNKGNTPVTAAITIQKDALSRLFTINSPAPMSSERKGFSVSYTWQKALSPTESLEVNSTTNYTIPLIILILVVAVGFLTKIYSQTALTLNKKVSFVRTKTGDLALKVNVRVKARKHVDKIQIVDSLPGMTKLYEKSGRLPDKVDHASRRVYWNIPSLNAGEERLFSYIVYSTVKVVGRFELPAATAVFEHEGKTKEAWSNRTFFVAGSGS